MHGSIKQKQDFTGSEFGQTLQDGLQSQFAHFGEIEASGEVASQSCLSGAFMLGRGFEPFFGL